MPLSNSLALPSIHPAVRLVAWCALVTAAQALTAWPLGAAVLLAVALASGLARRRLVLLFRRTRILLLSIALLFACGTPGIAWWPQLAAISPTNDGIALALEHGGRLILVLALLALLLEFTPPADLVSGVFGLMKPLARWGRIRQKVALRLLLVLQYVESERGRGVRRGWLGGLDWLENELTPAPCERLQVHARPLSAGDYLVLTGLAIAGGLALWDLTP